MRNEIFNPRVRSHTHTRWKNTFYICKRDPHKRPTVRKTPCDCVHTRTQKSSHVLRMCAFTYTRDKGGGGREIFVSVKRGKPLPFYGFSRGVGGKNNPPPVSRPVGSQNTHSGPPGGGSHHPPAVCVVTGDFFAVLLPEKSTSTGGVKKSLALEKSGKKHWKTVRNMYGKKWRRRNGPYDLSACAVRGHQSVNESS